MTRFELRSADGTLINARRWAPAGEPKAEILLCHGLAEHLGRYEWVGPKLAGAGYRVTGIELRGHGHSGGIRGHVMRWHEYVADLATGAHEIGVPHFIVAHSMGGNVALDYLRTATNVRGAAITGAFLGAPDGYPKLKILGTRLLSRLVPKLRLDTEMDPKLICTDPAVVDAYVADPLVFEKVSVRWGSEMLKAGLRILDHAPRYRTPLLNLWGEADRVVPVSRIERLTRTYGGPIQHRSWPGRYHELLNEPIRDEVMEEILSWLEARCASD